MVCSWHQLTLQKISEHDSLRSNGAETKAVLLECLPIAELSNVLGIGRIPPGMPVLITKLKGYR